MERRKQKAVIYTLTVLAMMLMAFMIFIQTFPALCALLDGGSTGSFFGFLVVFLVVSAIFCILWALADFALFSSNSVYIDYAVAVRIGMYAIACFSTSAYISFMPSLLEAATQPKRFMLWLATAGVESVVLAVIAGVLLNANIKSHEPKGRHVKVTNSGNVIHLEDIGKAS